MNEKTNLKIATKEMIRNPWTRKVESSLEDLPISTSTFKTEKPSLTTSLVCKVCGLSSRVVVG